MKKLLVGLCAIFISTFAFAHKINWHADNQIVQSTSCEIGGGVTPPTAPAKPGYHFKEWQASENLFDITALEGISGITIIDGNSFSVSGYPTYTNNLSKLAPGLAAGDSMIMKGASNNVYIGGFGTTVMGRAYTVTETMLNNGYVGFYRNTNGTDAIITNFQIIKNNN